MCKSALPKGTELLRGIKEDQSEWRGVPRSRTQGCWDVSLPWAGLYVQCNPKEMQASFFEQICQLILNSRGNGRRPRIDKTSLQKVNSSRQLTCLTSRLPIIKTVRYGQQSGHMGRWDGTEPRDGPTHICSADFLFYKDAKITQWGKDSFLTGSTTTSR